MRSPPATDPHVDLRNVSLTYGDGHHLVPAVEALDLQIGRGEFVAVVGSSGCGKSTLMKLVTGLELPNTGTVYFEGKPTTGPVDNVGVAFQNATLMPWRSTLENIMLPFEIVKHHKRELRKNRKPYEDRVKKLLETVGLLEFADNYPWELSGGMQQRANVCRALVHQPELLMLDEPFGALDAFTREELWLMTQNLWMQQHFSAVLVTHDLREAVFLADRVVVMSRRPGRVIMERRIDLPRPRDLSLIHAPEFADIVRELHATIVETRR